MKGIKVRQLFKRKQVLATLCIILFIISATVIIALTIGMEAGSFVIRVQDGSVNKSIMITNIDPVEKNSSNEDTPGFEKTEYDYPGLTKVLTAPAVDNFTDYSPTLFLRNQDGNYGFGTINKYTTSKDKGGVKENTGDLSGLYMHMDDKSAALYCYTFYIVNTGGSAVNVDIKMGYNSKGSDLDSIARVMSFTKDERGQEHAKIYYKRAFDKESNKEIEQNPYYPSYKGLTIGGFSSDALVYDDEKVFIDINSFVKYSIFFWLDGDDPDLAYDQERFYNATINFNLNISVNN